MSAAVDTGHGITITFGTSGFSANWEDADWSGINRESIPTSHLATAAAAVANATFLPSDIVDPGEMSGTLHFNPDTTPPTVAAAEQISIQFPPSDGDSTGALWVASGFVTSYGPSVRLGDKMTAAVTIKLTGNIAITPGS